MFRKITIVVLAVTMLLLIVTPAGAITFGEPDGDRHPNVGLLVADVNNNGTLVMGCSGTLISPTVYLTAGHCTNFLYRLDITKVWVTFDSAFDPQSPELIPIVGFATHPAYDRNTETNDVGVVILAEPVTNTTPVLLPTENLLDQMKAAGTLKDQTFVNVGYGATVDFKGNPPASSPRDGLRRFSTSPYSSLTPTWLHLLGNNDATGEGGGCTGDSGGPQFLGDTNRIVSFSIWGDAVCRSLGMSQRLDTPSVRAFLDDYVTLP